MRNLTPEDNFCEKTLNHSPFLLVFRPNPSDIRLKRPEIAENTRHFGQNRPPKVRALLRLCTRLGVIMV